MNIVTDEPLAVKPGIYIPQAAQHLLACIAVRGAVEDKMGFVFDRTNALCITVTTDALVEGHLGSALRTGEASQTVGVETQVQQDADIDITVQIITLLSDKSLERRFGHGGI